jgi:hypothetical protein
VAAPTTVLTLTKSMAYRNNPSERWSNTYAFTGSTPASPAAWKTLLDAVVAEERKVYISAISIVSAYGYNKIPVKGDHAVYTFDYTVTPNTPVLGSLPQVSVGVPAGDQAAWVRWGLDRFNTHGKRVYLRKYFHGGTTVTNNAELLSAVYSAALVAFGNKMRDGTLADARSLCDKDSLVPFASGVSPYMTTRTLKRRGKRPPR